eukprot:TRINITY_DN10644_c3_g1_i1.p1 TRINITY_DN10644_c3_g1~~TRINITY_DN10644_c3_g1_i1.p1  ORF type:complete len:415 (-),score=55.14 TRINITY_DN10644_c3_g1_i1:171-1415(-)
MGNLVFVTTLLQNFLVFPALLLEGRKAEEDIMRRTGLTSMCLTLILELAWSNYRPQPLTIQLTSLAAITSAFAQVLHFGIAFGLVPQIAYSSLLAGSLHFIADLFWIWVKQVGTAYVVTSNRSPAKYQILAWITVMILGTLVTLYPEIRQMPFVVVAIASLPRIAVASRLLLERSKGCNCKMTNQSEDKCDVPAGSDIQNASENENVPSLSIPRTLRFTIFACNGSTGEALNDMATDLKLRVALSDGDIQLALAYNCAVLLSMAGGYVSESMAAGIGARRIFCCFWGLCQVCRGFGMEYLTPDRTGLMFAFVFFDKFTGPLGQAAIDTALLSLLRRDNGGRGPEGWPRMPANAVWTLRAAAERLERPFCQLLLLHFGTSNAPTWVPLTFAAISVGFVLHTLKPESQKNEEKKVA